VNGDLPSTVKPEDKMEVEGWCLGWKLYENPFVLVAKQQALVYIVVTLKLGT
jgi:hypothetical protein